MLDPAQNLNHTFALCSGLSERLYPASVKEQPLAISILSRLFWLSLHIVPIAGCKYLS